MRNQKRSYNGYPISFVMFLDNQRIKYVVDPHFVACYLLQDFSSFISNFQFFCVFNFQSKVKRNEGSSPNVTSNIQRF